MFLAVLTVVEGGETHLRQPLYRLGHHVHVLAVVHERLPHRHRQQTDRQVAPHRALQDLVQARDLRQRQLHA